MVGKKKEKKMHALSFDGSHYQGRMKANCGTYSTLQTEVIKPAKNKSSREIERKKKETKTRYKVGG